MDRSTISKITIGFGIVYLLVGIMGFIPALVTPAADTSSVPGEGMLLGIFTINLVHNLAHILLGLILIGGGLAVDRVGAVNRVMAGVFLILAIATLISPIADPMLGGVNIPDFILHLGSALLTGYLGFVAARDTDRNVLPS
jgi:hypothetical protein